MLLSRCPLEYVLRRQQSWENYSLLFASLKTDTRGQIHIIRISNLTCLSQRVIKFQEKIDLYISSFRHWMRLSNQKAKENSKKSGSELFQFQHLCAFSSYNRKTESQIQ